jgi:hypothetical protein
MILLELVANGVAPSVVTPPSTVTRASLITLLGVIVPLR